MSATAEITMQPVNVASVDRFRFPITKDLTIWNLATTPGSVSATLYPPSGSPITKALTAESAAGGIFYFDTLVTDILVVGWWRIALTVTDGTVVKPYPYRITFQAVDNR